MQTTYKNNYTAPPSLAVQTFSFDTTPKWQDYDFNFTGGPVYDLCTNKIIMIPFNPILHASQYYEEIKDKADMLRYMPYIPRPWDSLEQCLAWAETLRQNPGTLLFAIFDTSGSIPLASQEFVGSQALPEGHPPLTKMVGVMGVLNVDRAHLTGEVGHIVIFPRAQRTHVNTHAVALMMHYLLDHPYLSVYDPSTKSFTAPSSSGRADPLIAPFPAPTNATGPKRALGLRRCQWQANHLNIPSARAAQRMGFLQEGFIRDQRVLVDSVTDTEEGRPGDEGSGGSRTSWMGALTWRDWEGIGTSGEGKEESVKERVDRLVARG